MASRLRVGAAIVASGSGLGVLIAWLWWAERNPVVICRGPNPVCPSRPPFHSYAVIGAPIGVAFLGAVLWALDRSLR